MASSQATPQVLNWDGAATVAPAAGAEFIDVVSPVDGQTIAAVLRSTTADVDQAVARAEAAFPAWSSRTVKSRAAVMFRFHQLLEEHAEELALLVTKESGKNHAEAIASVAKANETVEWACSMPQVSQGKILQVSRGVTCQDLREPLGVVASVVPFNFPIMVPMWTCPIALTAGNCVILKPSEKVPTTMARVAELLAKAGVPPGVFQMVQGTREAVERLCDHPSIQALTFVGSSPVAEAVASRCRALHKKCIALGGAKNHLVVLPDCEPSSAAHDIVSSFAGAAGQRCMAASVLVMVGDCKHVLDMVVEKASQLQRGTGKGQVGAVIDEGAKARILKYINESEQRDGARVLVDGRGWAKQTPGNWVGPTVMLHKSAADPACKEEIFGPVLSVLQVSTWEEALAIENANPFGNAACIYTSVGSHAEYFQHRFRAAMIGVNIGIPVPREPFSFGGMYGTLSKYGDMDITGEGCLEFFTNRRKITSKWPAPPTSVLPTSGTNGQQRAAGEVDKANFNGQM